MLKRAKRLAPAIRKRKLAMAPNCSSLLYNSPRLVGNCRNPQVHASNAGATPKVITSASESSSLPKSLLVPAPCPVGMLGTSESIRVLLAESIPLQLRRPDLQRRANAPARWPHLLRG